MIRYPDIQLEEPKRHTPDPPERPDQQKLVLNGVVLTSDAGLNVDAAAWENYEREKARWERNERKLAFYHALRRALPEHFGFDGAADIPANIEDLPGKLGEDSRAYFVTVAGVLLADNLTDPLVGRAVRDYTLTGDISHDGDAVHDCPFDDKGLRDCGDKDYKKKRRWYSSKFVGKLVEPVRFYKENRDLFRKLHALLAKEGQITNGKPVEVVNAEQLAEVGRRLIELNIGPNDPHLGLHAETALAQALGGKLDGRSAAVDIVLPDLNLDEDVSADVDKDNVMALAAIYFSAQLEEMKFFAVADKVAEQFMSGMVPVTRGAGGENIYDYIRDAPFRFTEIERRSLYARCFGIAAGAVEESLPNREFSDLWIRFLSAVSLANREEKSTERQMVSDQQIHKSARDLGVNLSLHGYGIAHFAAVELQALIQKLHLMLRQQEVLSAYGVRDLWQLVERVSLLYLGGSVNGVRQRTMAQAGSKVIQFVARHAAIISSPFSSNVRSLFRQHELVDNVERWLAVTGTVDTTVEQYSEPISQASQPTIPTLSLASVPDQLRQALRQVDLSSTPILGEA